MVGNLPFTDSQYSSAFGDLQLGLIGQCHKSRLSIVLRKQKQAMSGIACKYLQLVEKVTVRHIAAEAKSIANDLRHIESHDVTGDLDFRLAIPLYVLPGD